MTHESVKMIIMSHLSDLQEEIGVSNPGKNFYMNQKLNFVKYLVMHFPDINVEINADELWERFRLNKIELELKELRQRAIDLFETSLLTWTEQMCYLHLRNGDSKVEIPSKLLDMKKLIVDLEYNYIMQATEADVREIIKRFIPAPPSGPENREWKDSSLLTPVIE